MCTQIIDSHPSGKKNLDKHRFNATMYIYCSSFIFSYKAYKARKQLAAIDWNYHLNLDAATSKAGEVRVTRKYNQRTKEWDSKVVKVKKKYEYMPMLMARIMRLRNEDDGAVARHVSLNASDPARIAPNIAEKPAPPSKELFLRRKSRFAKSGESGESSCTVSDCTSTTVVQSSGSVDH